MNKIIIVIIAIIINIKDYLTHIMLGKKLEKISWKACLLNKKLEKKLPKYRYDRERLSDYCGEPKYRTSIFIREEGGSYIIQGVINQEKFYEDEYFSVMDSDWSSFYFRRYLDVEFEKATKESNKRIKEIIEEIERDILSIKEKIKEERREMFSYLIKKLARTN